ncbi:MAG TPA: diacylglycerol kinase family protein [Saprospiraceae bacterium]|nr:diacylglycerol kinase family protein [Saprospiraceae bacterium]
MDNTQTSKRKLLFVINPVAGDRDKGPAESAIEEYCADRSWDYRLMRTTGEKDEERIKTSIRDFVPDTIVAGGGDGTVNLIASMLRGQNQKLGILPLGSANGLATEFGISSNVREALDVLHKGKLITMDALLLNDRYHSFHLADIGYNAKMIQQLEESKKWGQWSYVLEFFRNMKERPVSNVHIKLPHRELKREVVMITFANARRYGTGAVINPRGKINDGKFEVCVFRPWPRWYLFKLGFLFFIGQLDESDYVDIYSTESVVIKTEGQIPFQSDGEVLGEIQSLKVEIEQEAVPVWVDQEYSCS